MTTNQDIIKTSSLFSDKSMGLKESHRYILSALNDHTPIRSFDGSFSVNRNNENQTGYFTHWSPIEVTFSECTSQCNSIYTVESNIHEDIVKKMSLPNNVTVNKTDNPLDYSIHSNFIDHQCLTSTSPKVTAHQQSNYNRNSSLEFSNSFKFNHNNTSSLRKSECTSQPIVCYATNDETDGGRLSKRKYSKNHSSVSRKYTGKYIKAGINKITGLNQPNVISIPISNNNTHINDRFEVIHANTINHSLTHNLLKETYSLNQNTVNEDGNSINGKKSKLDKNCPTVEKNSVNKQTIDMTFYSTPEDSPWNNGEDEKGKTNSDNQNNVKNTVVSTGAYKYLSWREKDRRRRFREEWKHLWLVIPHGLHEVMCLICHKVMTQRKLDTIKRHVVRRHPELLKMYDHDKRELFNQLIRQSNLIDHTNISSIINNPCKFIQKSNDSYKCNLNRNLPKTKESSQKLLFNTSNRLMNQTSNRNLFLKNMNQLNNIPLCYTPNSQSVYYKSSEDSVDELHEVVNSNVKMKQYLSSDESKYLPKMYQEVINSFDFNHLSSALPEDWFNLLKIAESLLPIVKSSSDGSMDPLDYSIHSSQHNPIEINMQLLSSNNQPVNTSMISTESLLSPNVQTINCSSFRPFSSSSKSSNLNINYRKSFTPMTYKSMEPMNSLPLSSIVQTKSFSNIQNLDKSYGFMESTSNSYEDTIKTSNENLAAVNCNVNFSSKNIHVQNDYEINDYDSSQMAKGYLNSQFHLTTEYMEHDHIVNELNQRLRVSVNATTSHANRTSTGFDPTFSKVPKIDEAQSLMIAAWYSALMNSTKNTNQLVNDNVSLNVHKPICNESVGMEQPLTFSFPFSNPRLCNTSPHVPNTSDEIISSRLKQKEKLSNYPSIIDSLQLHNQEVELQSSKQVNPSRQLKLNSDLNKFTISSLLNTEQRQITTPVSKAEQKSDNSCPNILSNLEMSSCDSSTDSSSQLGNKQKYDKFKSIPECISCILCMIHDMNVGNSSSNTNYNKSCRLNVDIPSNIYAKEAESYKRKHTAFTCPKNLPSSFYNSVEIQSKINASNQFNNDNCTSQNQIPFIHLLDSNNQPIHEVQTYMKCYYDELLRNHFEHIQKENQSSEKVTSSYCCIPINKENTICLNGSEDI
ncbi:unnamed protein product [Schistosoma intercalatum]|nr:unnamed protein product [Schistosoma intercalatum]